MTTNNNSVLKQFVQFVGEKEFANFKLDYPGETSLYDFIQHVGVHRFVEFHQNQASTAPTVTPTIKKLKAGKATPEDVCGIPVRDLLSSAYADAHPGIGKTRGFLNKTTKAKVKLTPEASLKRFFSRHKRYLPATVARTNEVYKVIKSGAGLPAVAICGSTKSTYDQVDASLGILMKLKLITREISHPGHAAYEYIYRAA